MSKTQTDQDLEQFRRDIAKGLSSEPKYLDSKYLYDERGDQLFQQIMSMPEYYLTDCEYKILDLHKKSISEELKLKEEGFDLVELGSGDGKKTKILLRYWTENNMDVRYIPVDISRNVLMDLKNSLAAEIPKLQVQIIENSYSEALRDISEMSSRKKIIMVLGSNIGNLNHDKATGFLRSIRNSMHEKDLLFIGFDQKKDPQLILNAYNDKAGITEAFNKNLLLRINRELQANFDPDEFAHWPVYDPENATAKSYLVSKKELQVKLKEIDLQVHFKAHECIYMEMSQKYDHSSILELAEKASLKFCSYYSDPKDFFRNYIFLPK